MEKDRKRALRRFHDARMLKRAEKMVWEWYYWDKVKPTHAEIQQQARRRRDHMCNCSCSSCGNPRHGDWSSRKDRLTMPEKRAENSYFDALYEYMTVDPNDNQE
ncbi:hypothetical protein LCGC14_2797320 [marine sediment metagenome]|uniref:Uncharacterized protein n=1 Tax=marine sediment metagenome TaxID=412755 RepID=A0A0F8YNQ1_9ZZZZ